MSEHHLISITDRHLVVGDFLKRVEVIAKMRPYAIILREKDLSYEAYVQLAQQVSDICGGYDVTCILNWRHPIVPLPGCGLQVSFAMREAVKGTVSFGVSIHSAEEAVSLRHHAAAWLLAGHVFDTTCKPGVAPRGLAFLHAVLREATQPVFAVGGMTPEHVFSVLELGAKGYAVRSPLMLSDNVPSLMRAYYRNEEMAVRVMEQKDKQTARSKSKDR